MPESKSVIKKPRIDELDIAKAIAIAIGEGSDEDLIADAKGFEFVTGLSRGRIKGFGFG